jgi:hypothetical protein
MLIRIGLENNFEGRSLAWALEQPGCFAYGASGPDAIIAMGQAIPAYVSWIAIHTGSAWFDPHEIDIRLVQIWECYSIDENYQKVPSSTENSSEINAWFLDDWVPLSTKDIDHAILMLSWSRADLLALINGFSEKQLETKLEGERWSIRGILNHVGGAEWWYLDRLGLANCTRSELQQDPIERLKVQRARLNEILPTLAGVNLVVGKAGEFWSPRKLVRRSLWHEIDHIRHILGLLSGDRFS